MNTGTVKFFNGQRGFGFITPDDGSDDIFVHVTTLDRAGVGGLADGQKVRFDAQIDVKSRKMAVVVIELA